LDRHGAHTTNRAQNGIIPNAPLGIKGGRPVNSTRFLTHQDQLVAMKKAQDMHTLEPKNVIDFDMGKPIGEGYFKGAGLNDTPVTVHQTTKVRAIFKDGKLNTMYPLLGTGK